MEFIKRLHSRLGDFWWYTTIVFLSTRLADVLNIFVGLYLVPKYIAPEELGAVLPLTSFATFLALPAFAFATTFSKELNTLAVNGKYGQMKTLMKSVFIAAALFLVLAVGVSRLVLPLFLDRIRVVEGSLGLLILLSAFLGCVSPVYTNALQALKRFNAISVLNLVSAPLRLITMLLAMPLRALSGYFLGQSATPAFTIGASIWLLRKELAVKAEKYWTTPIIRRFTLLFIAILVYQLSGMFTGLIEPMVIREHLPAVESAAYYMVTRFSDIANYLTISFVTVLFPMTAELAEKKSSTFPLVLRSSLAMLLGGGALAALFFFFGSPLMSFLPHGFEYAAFSWAIPVLVMINVLSAIVTIIVNTEVSAARFKFLYWWLPAHLLSALACYLLAERGVIASLSAMLWYFAITALVKLLLALTSLKQ